MPAISQNIRQMRFGARQRQEFSLPPMPQMPPTMIKRFPELAEYQQQMDRWREVAVVALADAILALSQDNRPAS